MIFLFICMIFCSFINYNKVWKLLTVVSFVFCLFLFWQPLKSKKEIQNPLNMISKALAQIKTISKTLPLHNIWKSATLRGQFVYETFIWVISLTKVSAKTPLWLIFKHFSFPPYYTFSLGIFCSKSLMLSSLWSKFLNTIALFKNLSFIF